MSVDMEERSHSSLIGSKQTRRKSMCYSIVKEENPSVTDPPVHFINTNSSYHLLDNTEDQSIFRPYCSDYRVCFTFKN